MKKIVPFLCLIFLLGFKLFAESQKNIAIKACRKDEEALFILPKCNTCKDLSIEKELAQKIICPVEFANDNFFIGVKLRIGVGIGNIEGMTFYNPATGSTLEENSLTKIIQKELKKMQLEFPAWIKDEYTESSLLYDIIINFNNIPVEPKEYNVLSNMDSISIKGVIFDTLKMTSVDFSKIYINGVFYGQAMGGKFDFYYPVPKGKESLDILVKHANYEDVYFKNIPNNNQELIIYLKPKRIIWVNIQKH